MGLLMVSRRLSVTQPAAIRKVPLAAPPGKREGNRLSWRTNSQEQAEVVERSEEELLLDEEE